MPLGHRSIIVSGTVAAALTFAAASAAQRHTTPQLIYEASPSLEPLAERLSTIDPKKLERAMSLVGVLEAGAPIRLALSDERSDLAARV